MKAGRLRHRILIQKPVAIVDSVTDDLPDYKDVGWRDAEIRPATVKEIFAAQGFIGQLDIIVVIRYEHLFDDLNNHWRLWHKNQKLNVIGKLNIDMRNRWLKIIATSDTDDVRFEHKDTEQPLHQAANLVLPELT
ncbi:head-tail adaptor protein [Endozoicomonas gorgoniicola]|uniref:Head-tail adaptor protein n=1 Tax=Endozoicomonas gorgoniicola TaxID=1234144 RepID=A0ABT3MRY8_9GAMM|nr:head-tail adaptor protein [Endozoicomonas gorgoniicola]MCW7552135.1 head-tail adaptor protein [Endozoicomonas gorgoniicola]